ncbi:TPA: hypothetical protein ACPSKB_002537 [Legionella feeleii]
MKIELRVGFKPYFNVSELSAVELKTLKEHVKQSLAQYYAPDLKIYSQTYCNTDTIYLTVQSVCEEKGKWRVEFSEQGEIDKRAWVNPQNPSDILVTAYEEGSSLSVSLP